jgi:Spy/CpxP family protein refolding chaperone
MADCWNAPRKNSAFSDEQVAKLKAELTGEKDTLRSLIFALHTARIALREAIQAPDANETSVRAASAKVAVAEADLAVERLKLYSKIGPILTEEQREKVKVFQAKIDDFLDTAINRIGEHLAE